MQLFAHKFIVLEILLGIVLATNDACSMLATMDGTLHACTA